FQRSRGHWPPNSVRGTSSKVTTVRSISPTCVLTVQACPSMTAAAVAEWADVGRPNGPFATAGGWLAWSHVEDQGLRRDDHRRGRGAARLVLPRAGGDPSIAAYQLSTGC